MKKSLEKRFFEYLDTLPNSEAIDGLNIPSEKKDNQKADYFVENRLLIVEVKSLKADPEHKIENEIDKHRNRDEFPLIYGQVELNKILAHLPDGNRIKAKIFEKITRSIEQSFRSANSQIKDTKDTFNLSDSIGLLVLLSDVIDLFDPQLVVAKISQMLSKKTKDELRYGHVTSVWIINETHFMQIKKDLKGIPTIIVDGPNAEQYENIDTLYGLLQKEWAKFNGLPLIFSDSKNIKDLPFKTFTDLKDSLKFTQPRHEIWRRGYKKDPYLRNLEEIELLNYGANLIEQIKPYFLKGGPKTTEEHFEKFGSLFTHFMEEMSCRGLDWKKIPKTI